MAADGKSIVCCSSTKYFQWLKSGRDDSDEDKKSCFVTLIAEDKHFKVHKTLIAYHSSFLDRMFKTNMREKSESSASLEEISSDTMKLIVDFIYATNIEINDDNVMDLFAASCFLQMDELKVFCSKYLLSSVNISNCISRYNAGIRYMMSMLVDEAENFIMENLSEIVAREDFLNFETKDVSTIIHCTDQKHSILNVKTLLDAVLLWAKHDFEDRKKDATDLLHLVKLYKLPRYYLKLLMDEEDLFEESWRENHLKEVMFWQSVYFDEEKEKKMYFVIINQREVKLFDMICLKWRFLPDLPDDGTGACSLIHDQRLYVIGGAEHSNVIMTLDFEDENAKWQKVGNTLVPRSTGSRAVHFGGVIVIGGGDVAFPKQLPPSEVDQCVQQEYSRMKNYQASSGGISKMQTPASGFPFGGNHVPPAHSSSDPGPPAKVAVTKMSSVETFDPKSGSQTKTQALLHRRLLFFVKKEDLLFAVGDDDAGANTVIERYRNHEWILESTLNFTTKAAVHVNGEIFCIGNGNTKSYSHKFRRWTTRPHPVLNYGAFDLLEVDNLLFLFGSFRNGDETTYTLQRYNPAKDAWTTVYKEKPGFSCSFLSAT